MAFGNSRKPVPFPRIEVLLMQKKPEDAQAQKLLL